MRRLSVLLVLALLVRTSAAAEGLHSALASITEVDLRSHLTFLASDALEGREAGTQGGHAAAAYLVDRLQAIGVRPAGEDGGYIQEFGLGYRNVLAVFPGSDPELRDEFILLGGHLDHVGFGTRLNSSGPIGRIHNGADDNASGLSAILEIAEALTKLAAPLPRSVVIALWDGEEKGLLGSRYWVDNPTVPVAGLRLAVNLDMVGRLRDESVTVYGARTQRGLRQALVRANQAANLRLDFDHQHKADSDHHSFYVRRIPYLMLFTGDHPDYHRPSDDVDKINFAGLEQISRIVLEVVVELAEDPRPAPFRNDSRHETSPTRILTQALPSRLGITWAPDRAPGAPFVIERVVEDSPAAVAGLLPGQRITAVNDIPAGRIEQFRALVNECRGPLCLAIETEDGQTPSPVTVNLAGTAIPAGARLAVDPADDAAWHVESVAPDSFAARAGFIAGDRIMHRPPQAPADRSASWTIERGGRLIPLQIEQD
ncbi:MAG: M20/M25/M40 family metallo-hydrolase [Planctomyces sp.]|nr:M20/M25/M40 family metallo-hydrolase [Planctomyces sp.]